MIGGEELINHICGEDKDSINRIRACIASPDIINTLDRVARILGPRELMPSYKSGTLTSNVGKAVKK